MLNYLKTIEDYSFDFSDMVERHSEFSSLMHEIESMRASKNLRCKIFELGLL